MKLALAFGIIVIAIIGVSLIPIRHTENAPFASPAFHRVWNSELASAARLIDLWGSEPLISRIEPYTGLPEDRRTVQYFERGRMELQPDSRGVTLGLLARELTTGRIYLGENVYDERQPPEISIDSGVSDARVPTYLTLSRIVGETAEDRTGFGQRVVEWIDRSGVVENPATPTIVRLERYIDETGHNLPDVTVELFQRSEFSGGRWIDAFGYPISEPYWTNYRRNETVHPALVQVFERRVLIYMPRVEEDRRFTVANTGRHYYRWRYGADLTTEPPSVAQELSSTSLTLPDGYIGQEYPLDVGTPLDLTLAPSGHLMILTEQGQILRANGLDPDAAPDGFSVWVDGIDQPRSLVTSGGRVLVSTGDGVQAFRDQDGHGVPDRVEDLDMPSGISPVRGPAGKLFADADGHIYSVAENGSDASALMSLDSATAVLTVNDLIAELGPMLFSDDQLIAAGSAGDGRSKLMSVPSQDGEVAASAAQTIVTFPPETVIHALHIADSSTWPLSEVGSLLVATEGEDGGSIFLLGMDQPGGATELFEFGRGFNRPVAMVFGMDGSLYVADAGLGRIIRIMHEA